MQSDNLIILFVNKQTAWCLLPHVAVCQEIAGSSRWKKEKFEIFSYVILEGVQTCPELEVCTVLLWSIIPKYPDRYEYRETITSITLAQALKLDQTTLIFVHGIALADIFTSILVFIPMLSTLLANRSYEITTFVLWTRYFNYSKWLTYLNGFIQWIPARKLIIIIGRWVLGEGGCWVVGFLFNVPLITEIFIILDLSGMLDRRLTAHG